MTEDIIGNNNLDNLAGNLEQGSFSCTGKMYLAVFCLRYLRTLRYWIVARAPMRNQEFLIGRKLSMLQAPRFLHIFIYEIGLKTFVTQL